jgi:hypothetical protein
MMGYAGGIWIWLVLTPVLAVPQADARQIKQYTWGTTGAALNIIRTLPGHSISYTHMLAL